jgi:hypothetical protein
MTFEMDICRDVKQAKIQNQVQGYIAHGFKTRFFVQKQISQSSIRAWWSVVSTAATRMSPTFGAATAKKAGQTSGASTSTSTGTLLLLTAMTLEMRLI